MYVYGKLLLTPKNSMLSTPDPLTFFCIKLDSICRWYSTMGIVNV